MASEKNDHGARGGGGTRARFRPPKWFIKSIKRRQTWKTFLRCMITLFGTVVLLVCRKTLEIQGRSAYFAMMLSITVPPSMALGIFIMSFMTLALGMMTGWAWGAAAMISAFRARDKTLLASQLEKAHLSLAQAREITNEVREAAYHGKFLDIRSTVVFAVFFFVGVYGLAWIRATKPRLMLFAFFGVSVLDVLCLYGPLYPTPDFLLPKFLLIPAAFYFAVALISSLIIFPESLNHQILGSIIDDALKPLVKEIKIQGDILNGDPREWDHIHGKAEEARSLRKEMVQDIEALEDNLSLLKIEFSRGQLNAKDVIAIHDQVKQLSGGAHVLAAFIVLMEQDFKIREEASNLGPEGEGQAGTSLADLFSTLASSSQDLRDSLEKSLLETIDWLNGVNTYRWSRLPDRIAPRDSREASIQDLRQHLAAFRQRDQFAPLQALHRLPDSSSETMDLESSKNTLDMFRCAAFSTSLIGFTEQVIAFLQLLLDLDQATPGAKAHYPAAMSALMSEMMSHKDVSSPFAMGKEHKDSDVRSEITLVGDPDSKLSSGEGSGFTRRSVFGIPRACVVWVGRRIISPQGIFALKFAIVSVALFIPFVCKSSTYFVYFNKGFWAVILAQLSLSVYSGEQISNFMTRVCGTGLGLVNGIVIWYIGAPGRGRGNPYGIAAATMVFTAPALFNRLVAPESQMPLWLMIALMSVFVVGYSWVDDHLPVIANAGDGAELAGRRALGVLIGLTAAFIVMLFPRPFSAKKNTTLSLAKCIRSTGDIYRLVVRAAKENDESVGRTREQDEVQEGLDVMRSKFVAAITQVIDVEEKIDHASLEPHFRGSWPKDRIRAIHHAENSLLNAVLLLGSTYPRLDPEWVHRLNETRLMDRDRLQACLREFDRFEHSLMSETKLVLDHDHDTAGVSEDLSKGITAVELWSRVRSSVLSEVRGASDKREAGRDTTWDEQMPVYAATVIALIYTTTGIAHLKKEIAALNGTSRQDEMTIARAARSV
ncbi:hypothetical protein BD324DRAFT_629981 [Kockovaella imperatae]|uniref:ER transporter 6TM N-terminal domain-containing protein n=1 Tax=Kockovaella imperatae TaxID=4999 RepID=A0A1Y1UDB8_9TREE|nr:hypothetical protein BD324DRAFT_629981 [Kockovaella imperatae]ORX36048.1 hypothetical protein BD324DRAFT_629981 [Kockovaella imperatae]